MARDTATTKTRSETDVETEDVTVEVDTGDDIRVIQYGNVYGLFDKSGKMLKGDIASRHEANEQKTAMSQKGTKGSKASAKVEDDDGAR